MANSLNENNYHGIFRKLAALNICDDDAHSENIYGPQFADFYNTYVGSEVDDIPFYENHINADLNVLDLACGSGRIGIALARKGCNVDGIELSQDMLNLIDENLQGESADTISRLNSYQGDITQFKLDKTYDLILIGATSISLLLSREERLNMFRCVAKHLKPEGKFIFDTLNLTDNKWKNNDHFMDVWSHETDNGQEFSIVGQEFSEVDHTFTFNVYRELIDWCGETKRYMATSTKAWLLPDQLENELLEEGLKLSTTTEQGQTIFFVCHLLD